MAYSSLLSIPFVISLLLPAYKSLDLTSDSFWLSNGFVYTIILIMSMINGLGEGVNQPASGTYISDCATEHNKGFYFAMFWAFYMGSQVFGNLIAAFVLGNLDQRYYVAIMTGLTIVSCGMMFFLKKPVIQHEHLRKTPDQIDEQTRNVRASNRQSMISVMPPDDKVDTLWGSVQSMWKLTWNKRFMYLIL